MAAPSIHWLVSPTRRTAEGRAPAVHSLRALVRPRLLCLKEARKYSDEIGVPVRPVQTSVDSKSEVTIFTRPDRTRISFVRLWP